MHCTRCGEEIFKNDRFCGACGYSLLDPNEEMPSEVVAPKIISIQEDNKIGQKSTRELDDNDLLKAFVGEKKHSYYLGKWDKNEHRSWNWAAFFGTLLWLGYR